MSILDQLIGVLVREYGYREVETALHKHFPGVVTPEQVRELAPKFGAYCKISAIKAYRELRPKGLMECKHWVEENMEEFRQ